MRTRVGRVRKFLILHGATRILVICLGLLAAFLALSGYVSLVNLDRVAESSRWVAHTREVMSDANAILATVLNAETRGRGFLLSGEESFATQMRTEAADLTGQFQHLTSLTDDNSGQSGRVSEFKALVDHHQSHLMEMVAEGTTGPGGTAALEESRTRLDRVRAKGREIIDEENRLLNLRLDGLHRTQSLSTFLTVFQTIAGLALAFVGAYVLQRELNARLKVEKQVRSLLAEISDESRRKDEFLATLSHELRNPLAPLTTSTELMKRMDPSDPRWAELFGVHQRQLNQLVHLVDDLLDLSRVVNNKIEINRSPLDIRDVIKDAVAVTRGDCEAKGIQFTVDHPELPMLVSGDQVRLLQVFGNLLNNACKFTPADGQVSLTATSDDKWIYVTFSDTGRGIATADLEGIFTMFAQVNGSDREMKNGLGIGLSLAKTLVELHGGDLSVQSEGLGKGSKFIVKLPKADVSMSEQSETPAEKSSMTNLRVLIADDNEDAARMISLLIGTLGGVTEVAGDGEQAVTKALEFQPDLILMDIGMPGMDGYEACRTIRKQGWGKEVMIVALTGWGQDRDKEKTAEAGFDKHLVKPVSIKDLEQVLDECQARTSKN